MQKRPFLTSLFFFLNLCSSHSLGFLRGKKIKFSLIKCRPHVQTSYITEDLLFAVSQAVPNASCEGSVCDENWPKLILIEIIFYAGSRRNKGRIWLTPLASAELMILFSWARSNNNSWALNFDCNHLAAFISRNIEPMIKGVINNIIVLLATLPVVLNRALSSRGSSEQLHIYADNESNPFLTPRPPHWIVLKQSKLR